MGDVSEDNTEPEANTEQNTEQNTEHVNYDYTVLPLAVDRYKYDNSQYVVFVNLFTVARGRMSIF